MIKGGFLVSGVFSGNDFVAGIVIGLMLYFWLKKRNAAQADEE